jgi:hypothetical protein
MRRRARRPELIARSGAALESDDDPDERKEPSMNNSTHQPLMALAVTLLLTPCFSAPALSQQAPAASAPPARLPLGQVLAQIGQNAGVIVLADSTIQGRVPVPATPATPETVEQQIAAVVQALPAGTTWARLYVPAPFNGRWNGDVVANYAHALAQIVGTVGRAAPAGTVEILGRRVPADKANEHITALNLKLVYLVTNPRAPTMPAAALNPASGWQRMTPDQRQQYVQFQAQRLLALDPATRLQTLRQLMQPPDDDPRPAILQTVFSQLTDAERIQLKQSLGGGK